MGKVVGIRGEGVIYFIFFLFTGVKSTLLVYDHQAQLVHRFLEYVNEEGTK